MPMFQGFSDIKDPKVDAAVAADAGKSGSQRQDGKTVHLDVNDIVAALFTGIAGVATGGASLGLAAASGTLASQGISKERREDYQAHDREMQAEQIAAASANAAKSPFSTMASSDVASSLDALAMSDDPTATQRYNELASQVYGGNFYPTASERRAFIEQGRQGKSLSSRISLAKQFIELGQPDQAMSLLEEFDLDVRSAPSIFATSGERGAWSKLLTQTDVSPSTANAIMKMYQMMKTSGTASEEDLVALIDSMPNERDQKIKEWGADLAQFAEEQELEYLKFAGIMLRDLGTDAIAMILNPNLKPILDMSIEAVARGMSDRAGVEMPAGTDLDLDTTSIADYRKLVDVQGYNKSENLYNLLMAADPEANAENAQKTLETVKEFVDSNPILMTKTPEDLIGDVPMLAAMIEQATGIKPQRSLNSVYALLVDYVTGKLKVTNNAATGR